MKRRIQFELELRKNPYRGKYIALEGTEAAGKTTQAKALEGYFKNQGKTVLLTHEPRKEGLIGDLVHKVLKGEVSANAVGLQYLFATDRALHQEELVVPALKRGEIVITDRCFWSAVVYGILDKSEEYSKGNVDQLLVAYSILSLYHQFISPDYTFYLKIPLDVSIARLTNERKQAKEIYEEENKIKKIIEGYDFLASRFASEITIVDGTREIEEVTKEIISKLT